MSPFRKMIAAGFQYANEDSAFGNIIFDRWDKINGIDGVVLKSLADKNIFYFKPYTLPGSPYKNTALWYF